MRDERVEAIRKDKLVGEGSCSSIDECMDDSEILEELNGLGIKSPRAAVNWARNEELLWREMGTNASSGEPDCPLIAAYRNFERLMKTTPILAPVAEKESDS